MQTFLPFVEWKNHPLSQVLSDLKKMKCGMKIKWKFYYSVYFTKKIQICWYYEIGKISSNNLLLHVTSLHSQTK